MDKVDDIYINYGFPIIVAFTAVYIPFMIFSRLLYGEEFFMKVWGIGLVFIVAFLVIAGAMVVRSSLIGGSSPRPKKKGYNNSDWISVDDRLPEEEGRYEFKIDNLPAEENGHWDSKDKFSPEHGWMYDWYTVGITRVTHWRPNDD